MPDKWSPTSEQVNRLLAELGRCLFIYQSIEAGLKRLLPHLIAPGEDAPATNEGIANWRVFLDSKETMGPLMQRFKDRVTTTQRDLLDSAWAKIVTHRNEVVHHFVEQPFSRFATEEEFLEAMRYLHERCTLAIPLLEIVQGALRAFVEGLTTERNKLFSQDNNVIP